LGKIGGKFYEFLLLSDVELELIHPSIKFGLGVLFKVLLFVLDFLFFFQNICQQVVNSQFFYNPVIVEDNISDTFGAFVRLQEVSNQRNTYRQETYKLASNVRKRSV
jgi:hypothetical protein